MKKSSVNWKNNFSPDFDKLGLFEKTSTRFQVVSKKNS